MNVALAELIRSTGTQMVAHYNEVDSLDRLRQFTNILTQLLAAVNSEIQNIERTPDLIYFGTPIRVGEGWAQMLEQYRLASLPHAQVDWHQGVLPSQAGTNIDWIKAYDDFKPFYQNAQEAGIMPHAVQLIPQGEKAFKDALRAAFTSAWGQAWMLDERTVAMRPKRAVPA